MRIGRCVLGIVPMVMHLYGREIAMTRHTYKQLFAIGITITLFAGTSWGADPPRPPLVSSFDSDQAKPLQKAWVDHLGPPVRITNAIGMKFNLVPPGQLMIRNPDSMDDDRTVVVAALNSNN
jgi:hypothetical protein